MRAMQISIVLACTVLAAVPTLAGESAVSPNPVVVAPSAEQKPVEARKPLIPHVRAHDTARTVVRTAHASAHDGAMGVVRPAPASELRFPRAERVAVLDRSSSACDSILCPGYAMMGVGF